MIRRVLFGLAVVLATVLAWLMGRHLPGAARALLAFLLVPLPVFIHWQTRMSAGQAETAPRSALYLSSALLLLTLTALPLGGCGLTEEAAATIAVGGVAGTIAVLGRSPPDVLVSLVRGQDCSVVRLEAGKTYCKPQEPPPPQPPFCTRSLGVVNCWSDPGTLQDHPTQVADGPMTLSPAQEADRTRRWPW